MLNVTITKPMHLWRQNQDGTLYFTSIRKYDTYVKNIFNMCQLHYRWSRKFPMNFAFFRKIFASVMIFIISLPKITKKDKSWIKLQSHTATKDKEPSQSTTWDHSTGLKY